MSEYASSYIESDQPSLPELDPFTIIAHMDPQERAELRTRYLNEISDREYLVRLVNEANDAEGIDITII